MKSILYSINRSIVMRKLSIDKKLMAYELAIGNALNNSVILSGFSEYGYDKTRIDEGNVLLLNAKTLYEMQKVEYAGQYGATENLQKASKIAYEKYVKTLSVCRIAYKNDVNWRTKLVLDGERKRTLAGWVDQAERMYKNLIDVINVDKKVEGLHKEPVETFGYTYEKLLNEYELVKKVKELNMNQKMETGEAQEYTKKKDDAIKKIDDWMGDYLKIAAIAFKDNVEILEQLGIKSSKRKSSKSKNAGKNNAVKNS
jgi:hypothetical protein